MNEAQAKAFDELSRHPFFEDCYGTGLPLIVAMLSKLDGIKPREYYQ